VEDYGPFLTAQVPAAEADTFAARALARGLTGRTAPEFAEIRLRGYSVPGVLAEAPSLPADLRIPDYTGITGLYLVQFRSRVRPAWLTDLRLVGARVLHYFPENTYLVALDRERRAQLGSVAGWRHDIVYQPGYKLDEYLRTIGPSVQRAVVVQLDRGQSWQDLVAQIRQRSSTEVAPSELGDHVNVGATLTGTDILNLLPDSRVLWVEAASQLGLSDERLAQIGVGNFTISGATNPGQYLGWLNTKGILDTSEHIVNVIDTGLSSGASMPVHSDLAPRIHSWVPEDRSGQLQTSDHSGHGTMIAGIIAGNPQESPGTGMREPCTGCDFFWGMGVAPGTQLRITDIFTTGDQFTGAQTSWDGATSAGKLKDTTKAAWQAGSRFTNLSSNLVGSPTTPATVTYDSYAQAVDLLTRDSVGFFTLPLGGNYPMMFGISTGNIQEAHYMGACLACVVSPATAKNAIVMGSSSEVRQYGACDDTGSVNHVSGFSARGAVQDPGRIKPDFVAPGTRVVSTFTSYRGDGYLPGSLCPSDPGGYVPSTGEAYGYGRGTSYSAPQATGQAVLLSKRFKNVWGFNPSPAMIKAMMAIGADRMLGGQDMYSAQLLTGTPGIQGWGRLNLAPLVDGTSFVAADEDRGTPPISRFTSTGQVLNYWLTVADPSKPVRVALAFTDRYGAVNAVPSRVNALSVYAFAGSNTYCDGSYDSAGYTPPVTVCGPPNLNNTLHVITIAPNTISGQFVVQIRAEDIAMMAVPWLDGYGVNQDWAAWVYNAY